MVFHRLLRNRLGLAGMIVVAVVLSAALFAPALAPYSPTEINVQHRFSGPTLDHPMGTDALGRDTLSRILHGSRITLGVALAAVAIAAVAGVAVGTVAGWFGGAFEAVTMRIVDAVLAFPMVLTAIVLVAVLGVHTSNLVLAMAIPFIPQFARLARGEVLKVRHLGFVEAAISTGAPTAWILWKHVVPNILATMTVHTTVSLAQAIIVESTLSFFGMGVQPPYTSWGAMISNARVFLAQSPWLSVFPGIVIVLTVLGFNFLGDGLRDANAPRT